MKKRFWIVSKVKIIKVESKGLKGLGYKKDHIQKVFYFLDRDSNATFSDYLFLRRVTLGFTTCANLGKLMMNRLYCAL